MSDRPPARAPAPDWPLLQFPQAYIVAIDVAATQWDYTQFATELEKSYNWWRYMRYMWIVVRFETQRHLVEELRRLIHPYDRLLVLPAKWSIRQVPYGKLEGDLRREDG